MTDREMIRWGLAAMCANAVLIVLGLWKMGELIVGVFQ